MRNNWINGFSELNIGEMFGMLVESVTDKKEIILDINPHYSDRRFKEPQTVFGIKPKDVSSGYGHKNLEYVYSDRLQQWDYDKHEKATETASKKNGKGVFTAEWYELYLSEYFDEPIDLQHIMAGVNHSNGHPYQVFGFIRKNKKEKK